jgi:tetratricopeptide (TPR) repeat protein
MHDLVRIYGRSHRIEGLERRDLIGSLITHYAERARDAGNDPAWLAVERPNILATVRAAHAVKPPPAKELVALLNATSELFDRAQDGLSWQLVAEAVLRTGEAAKDDLAQAAAHDDLSVISRLGLRLDEAEYHGRLSLALYRSAGAAGHPRLSRVWNRLGTIYTLRSDYTQASRCYSASLALRRAAGDRLGQASVLNNLGLARRAEGDMTAAEECFHAAGELYRSLNDLQGEAIALLNVGDLYRRQGRYRQAINAQRHAAIRADQAGSRSSVHHAWCGMADAVRDAGHPTWAVDLYRRCLAGLTESGDHELRAAVQAGLAAAGTAMTR